MLCRVKLNVWWVLGAWKCVVFYSNFLNYNYYQFKKHCFWSQCSKCQLNVFIIYHDTTKEKHATGWSKGSEYCNNTLTYWKMPKWDKYFILSKSSYWKVQLFTILLLYAQKLAIKTKLPFFKNAMEMGIYTRCKKKLLSNIQRFLKPF